LENEITCGAIYENKFRFGVSEDIGYDTRVKARVDVVENCTGEGDGEVEFIHGGDVGGDNGDDVSTADSEGGD
jgi:hypothetical protein